jgi:hypothetical protein
MFCAWRLQVRLIYLLSSHLPEQLRNFYVDLVTPPVIVVDARCFSWYEPRRGVREAQRPRTCTKGIPKRSVVEAIPSEERVA